MKPGFILFGVSVSNDDVYGFVPHNLTIIDESDLPSNASLAVVKNVTITLPAIQTILQATELKRPAVHYQWTPYPEIPMEMVHIRIYIAKVANNKNNPTILLYLETFTVLFDLS